MSKHDDRRNVEAGPSLSTVVPRADADKLGPSNRLDLVSVGAAGKVQIVRVTQAMYDTIPTGGVSFFHREFRNAILNVGGGTFNILGTYTVPDNQVLDISSLKFIVHINAGLIALPDYAFCSMTTAVTDSKMFEIRINNVSSFDIAASYAVAGNVWSFAGSPILNQDWFSWWTDSSVHLIAMPSQVVTLGQWDYLVSPHVGLNDTVRVHMSGRSLSYSLFNKIVSSNRIS